MRGLFRKNKGFTLIRLIMVIAVIGMLCATAMPALAADGSFTTNKHWKEKWEVMSGTAAETISLGDALCFNKASGRVYKADANDQDRWHCIGLAGTAATSGNYVQIVTRGVLSGMPCGLGTEASSCVTPIGMPLLLSTVQGGVTIISGATAFASGVSQFLGYAMPLSQQAVESGVTTGTDTYLVDVSAPKLADDGGWN